MTARAASSKPASPRSSRPNREGRRIDRYYWPENPTYALPWLLAPTVAVALGALGFPGFTNPETAFEQTISTAGASALWLGAAVLCSLWMLIHVRAHYLTWRTTAIPVLGTLLIISTLHFAAWAAALAWKTDIWPAILPSVLYDAELTARAGAFGQIALAAVLTVGLLWRTEEPGVAKVLSYRRNAREALERFQRESLLPEEFPALKESLANIVKERTTLLTSLGSEADRALLREWIDAAEALGNHLAPVAPPFMYESAEASMVEATLECLGRNLARG